MGAWLAAVTHLHEATARRRSEAAATLALLPGFAAALANGAITSDHVERLVPVIDEAGLDAVRDDESALVDLAERLPAKRFVRRLRAWTLRQHERAGRPVDERARKQRGVTAGTDPVNGWGHLRARLPLDEHQTVMNMLWALVREQWQAEHGEASDVDRDDPTIPQRLADALVEMACRAAGANPRHRSRPAVVVTIGLDDLRRDLDECGLGYLDDGTPVSPSTARRLACEAQIYPVVLGGESRPLDLGRSRRLASDEWCNACSSSSTNVLGPHGRRSWRSPDGSSECSAT